MIYFRAVNSSKISMNDKEMIIAPPTKDTPAVWRMYQKKKTNFFKEFVSCNMVNSYATADLTCSDYGKLVINIFL